jgi:hypothetical protein
VATGASEAVPVPTVTHTYFETVSSSGVDTSVLKKRPRNGARRAWCGKADNKVFIGHRSLRNYGQVDSALSVLGY